MRRPVVLDASALLAVVRGEDGADRVASELDGATIAAPNLAEVLLKMRPEFRQPMREVWGALGLKIEPVTEADAVAVAELFDEAPKSGLSLGDRFCVALALRMGAQAWTADKVWSDPARVGAGVASVAFQVR